ncbi:ABC-2 family transporter protein [Bacillus sp. THAF10]|uniref:ABC transporter permease n=1 Tax=Bacillus sp. THAF10 TaxID=2587848 RepID=UPI0012A9F5BF|nr:ABC transporter permease [Bacillus sp. THAF10]QFT91116.1 ABC-2 family transporter protein [Bacillus sp. THAF10]
MVVLGEFKKMHRTGVYLIIIFLSILPISFQGILGILADVQKSNLFITTTGLFFRLFIIIAIGLIISYSFSNEYRKNGYLNSIYNGISITHMFKTKLLFTYLIITIYIVISIAIACIFIYLAGGGVQESITTQLKPILFIIISVFILVNIHFVICLVIKQSPTISLLVALLGGVSSIFFSSTPYWILNPWSYPYRVLYFSSVKSSYLVIIIFIFLGTLIATIISILFFGKTKHIEYNR